MTELPDARKHAFDRIALCPSRCYATGMLTAPPFWIVTLRTLALGAGGAVLAWVLGLPVPMLIGPALAVSLVALAGVRAALPDRLRDSCFVIMGLGIGAGFDPNATAAILRWPLAFAALTVGLLVTMSLCRAVLTRGFGFDSTSALLASAPGHLSFVLGLAADTGGDIGRVAVVQTIRLLALTVTVPFVALAMGIDMRGAAIEFGAPMMLWHLILLMPAGVLAGLACVRLRLPAPMLLGAMAVSAATHATSLTPGAVPSELMIPTFAVLGTLIGTRFSGMSLAQFRAALAAGLITTAIAVGVATLIALPVAAVLSMPAAQVLAAFSPGGLETMVALGAAMGASPGFVAACHFMRLMILSVLIPLSLRRVRANA